MLQGREGRQSVRRCQGWSQQCAHGALRLAAPAAAAARTAGGTIAAGSPSPSAFRHFSAAMTSRSWGPPKGWALASALLHAATLSLLFSGWRELSALSELRHPSHQSSSMSASPGRRLQVSVRDRRTNWARWSCRTAACTVAQAPVRRCGRRKPADRADPLVVAGRLLPCSVAAARPPQHGTHASSCAHRDRLAPPHGPHSGSWRARRPQPPALQRRRLAAPHGPPDSSLAGGGRPRAGSARRRGRRAPCLCRVWRGAPHQPPGQRSRLRGGLRGAHRPAQLPVRAGQLGGAAPGRRFLVGREGGRFEPTPASCRAVRSTAGPPCHPCHARARRWVNPQTGTLWVRCKLSVEPAPYAATATPPPQYAAARTAVEIVGDAGAPGLGVSAGVGRGAWACTGAWAGCWLPGGSAGRSGPASQPAGQQRGLQPAQGCACAAAPSAISPAAASPARSGASPTQAPAPPR